MAWRRVFRKQSEKLIARAMKEPGPTHRCLLARPTRRDDVESQIADASEAVGLSPAYAEAHLFLARPLLCREDVTKRPRLTPSPLGRSIA